MKKILLFLFIGFFTGLNVFAQVKFVCIGNSITHGKYSSGVTAGTSIGDSLKEMSYRFWFWEKVDSAGVNATMVGSNTTYFNQFANTVVSKSRYTGHTFVNQHEAFYGIKTDGFLAGGFSQDGVNYSNFDTRLASYTPDVVLIHIGFNDDVAQIAQTEANYKSIITKLRARNPNVTVLLSGMNADWKKEINGIIPRVASEMTTVNSIVYPVDITTGFVSDIANPATTMTLDWVHPNAKGQKHMALRFYNAYMKVSKADAIAPTAPTKLSIFNAKATSFDLTWIASSDNVGVHLYRIYIDGVLSATTANTTYTITGMDIKKSHQIRVAAVDYQKNESAKSIAIGYPCTVTIIASNDVADRLESVSVYLNSSKKTTNVVGEAVYTSLVSGDYKCQINATGYKIFLDTFVIHQDTTITVIMEKLTNIDLAQESFNTAVYPNPTDGLITISDAENSVIEVIDITGRVVKKIIATQQISQMNLCDLENGYYVIKIAKNNKEVIKTILLQK